MLKDISFIKLQGANFSTKSMLPILASTEKKYIKLSLIYGKNGAGKSTIAKAFRKIKGESVTTVTSSETFNEENQPVVLSDKEKASIVVFDEDFITDNVRIERSGLGSIVMLGEQADLTEQIELAEKQLEQANDFVKTKEDIFKEYQNSTSPKAPRFYLNKIHDVLQCHGGWAERDSMVKNRRQNSRVTDETYKKFIAQIPEKSKDELVIAFNTKMKELDAAKVGVSTINSVVPIISDEYIHYSTTLANELIKKKIEKPELNEREKYLFSLITAGKAEELQERINYLNHEESAFCPYCLQDLSSQYKDNLVTRIKHVLTDEVKHHQTNLKTLKIPEIVLDLSPFASLSPYQTCVDLLRTINDTLLSNNALIQRKIDDPYSPITDKELSGLAELIKSLSETLKALDEERKLHNSMAVDTQPIEKELLSINDQIAYYDVIDYSKQLDRQQKELLSAKKICDEATFHRNEIKNALDELNGRRKCIDIAIDIINNGLKYIFFAENRLTLQRDGDFYKLLSNGCPVPPKNVSVGERNIIGLCYFFTSIMTGKNKDTAYNDEYVIVIDDPVSSYDFENKIGILSFLKYKLGQFLNRNVNSRAVVMTHDLITFFDLEKICNELAVDWKRIYSKKDLKYAIWELKDCTLKKFEYKKRHEYTELIRLTYDYACGKAGEYDIVIGNIMRQALEAFATFEYKKGIAEISTDETILSGMCNEHKSYFKNLMYRIVLNNGSHREEQEQSLKINFLSVISESEKRRTAKEIISFIYLLNKRHMLAHLGDVSKTVEIWCEEIKNRSAVI